MGYHFPAQRCRRPWPVIDQFAGAHRSKFYRIGQILRHPAKGIQNFLGRAVDNACSPALFSYFPD